MPLLGGLWGEREELVIRTRTLQLAALLAAFAAVASPVRADGIRTITSGTVATTGLNNASAVVSGPDFFLSTRFFAGIGRADTCQPCEVGDNIHIDSRWSRSINAADLMVTVDPQTAPS